MLVPQCFFTSKLLQREIGASNVARIVRTRYLWNVVRQGEAGPVLSFHPWQVRICFLWDSVKQGFIRREVTETCGIWQQGERVKMICLECSLAREGLVFIPCPLNGRSAAFQMQNFIELGFWHHPWPSLSDQYRLSANWRLRKSAANFTGHIMQFVICMLLKIDCTQNEEETC